MQRRHIQIIVLVCIVAAIVVTVWYIRTPANENRSVSRGVTDWNSSELFSILKETDTEPLVPVYPDIDMSHDNAANENRSISRGVTDWDSGELFSIPKEETATEPLVPVYSDSDTTRENAFAENVFTENALAENIRVENEAEDILVRTNLDGNIQFQPSDMIVAVKTNDSPVENSLQTMLSTNFKKNSQN